MKRILSVLIIIALMLASVLAIIPTSAATGTAINTADEFLAMDPAGSYYLAADIELTAPFDADFKGTFDGNGKTITVAASALSAFKKINGGSVCNLTVKADYSVPEPNTFGVLARKASGVFTDITVDANVVVLPEANSFKGGAGLLFGEIVGDATVSGCVSKGSIDVQTKTHPKNDDSALLYGVGGMVGRITTGAVSFFGCENYAFVNSLQAGMPSGGLVGETAGSASIQLHFENCVNYGEVITFGVPSGEGNAHTGAGGILGEALGVHSPDSTFTFKNCANHGYIHANEACGRVVGIGGIVGRGYSPAVLTIDGCINTADLDSPGTGWSGAGGIVGTLMTYGFAWSGTHDGKIKILNCVNLGDLNAANAFAGGIVAAPFQFNTQNSELYFENCANYGDVTGKNLTAGITPYAGWYGLSGIIFKNCLNAGTVTSTGESASGIIARINKLEEKTYSGDPNPTLIEGCVNIGTVFAQGTNGVASGIVGQVDTDDTTIKNCMNMGVVTGTKASAYIMPESEKTVTAEGNVYFGAADDSMKYGSATDGADIEARMVAISALVPFDSSSLYALVEEASEYSAADYIGGWDAFASALAAAKAVTDRASSEADVEAARTALESAILGLESPEKADFAALDAALADAAAYAGKEASYTPASWSAFAKALADAETLRASNPKQTAVDAAAAALSAAIAGLTAKADIAPLEAELAKHSSYVESEYVAATWSAFASAKSAAEALKTDVNASDADVAAAVKALADAAAALDKKASADQLSALSAKAAEADSEHPSDNYTSSSYQALRNA
ncbi:MAG: FIVAR domain-containing protein, partial [Clostridia bacterium]|nr:FIVAR domain-containing protein [Clostridia bacterium]